MKLPDNKKRRALAAAAAVRRASVATPPTSARALNALLRQRVAELEQGDAQWRRAQAALAQALDRYRDLYEAAPVAYLCLTPDGLIEQVNLTGARLLLREPQGLLGMRFAALVAAADDQRWQQTFAAIKECRESASLELGLTRGDGALVQVQLDGACRQPFCAAPAAALSRGGVGITLIDVSERRQAERSLRASHETLCSILATTRDGYWHADAQGRLIDVNAVYCEQSGYARSELIGRSSGELVASASARESEQHLQRIAAVGSGQFESTQQRRDGSLWYAEVSVTYRDSHGGEFFVFLRDISERKRADETLREQKEFFHLIAESIGDFIAVLDPDGKRIYNSPSYLQFFGAKHGLRGSDSFAEVHPDDRERVKQAFRETVQSGVGRRLAYRFQRADGSISEMESQGSVIRDAEGRPVRVVVVSHDVTERKRAERALTESEAFKNNVLNSVAAEIAVIDRNGVIQAVNERWRLFARENSSGPGSGALPGTEIGANYLALCAADPAAGDAYNGIRGVLDGLLPSYAVEYACHCESRQRWFSMIVTPLGHDSQHGVAITHTDVTALKQAERYEQFRSRILELLADGKPLPVILEALALGVELIEPALLCSIFLLDHEGQHLCHGVAPSLPEFYVAALEGVPLGVGLGSCSMAAYTGERVIVEDIARHPFWARFRALAASAGLGACWSQPIRAVNGNVLGTLAVYHRQARAATASDLVIIEQSARLASIAIERNLAAEKLKDSEAHYRLLTEEVSDVVWKQDCEHRFTYISPADERLRGYRADEVIGRYFFDFLTREGVAAASQIYRKMPASDAHGPLNGTSTIEVQQRCKDGRLIWVEVLSTPERDAGGRITGYHGISRDISERKAIEAQFNKVQNLLKETERIGRVGGWEFHLDSCRQVWTEEVYNIHEVSLDFEPSLENGLAFYTPESRPLIEHAVRRAIDEHEPFDLELEIITGKGHRRSVHAIGKPDPEGRRIFGFYQDVTERRQMEEQMRQLAFYDPLTKLPNRRLFTDRLVLNMAASARSGLYAAVMFIDLDNFKPLNDKHGHEVGDLLLVEVAARMKNCVREVDTVARVGGDEFVVMLSELSLDPSESSAQAELVAEKIRQALAQPYRLALKRGSMGSVEHRCSACIGVVLFNNHEATQGDIMSRADRAMYEAKAAGRNCIRFNTL